MNANTTDRQPLSTARRMSRPTVFPIRRVQADDAESLAAFYNGLSTASKRTFHPLGEQTTLHECRKIVKDNRPGIERKLDLIATQGREIVGWGFLWDLDRTETTLGLAIADKHRGEHLGTRLVTALMNEARAERVKIIKLIVVRDNKVAQRLYEKFGFEKTGEFDSTEDGLSYWRMAANIADASQAVERDPVPGRAGKRATETWL